jgi:hypothetical protein
MAEPRLARLEADFGDRVALSYHFGSSFGHVRRKLGNSGKSDREYGAMVCEILERHQLAVHPEVFLREVPTSSIPAHLYLRAVKILEEDGRLGIDERPSPFERLMRAIRLAFFRDLRDVSKRGVLDDLAESLAIPSAEVGRVIDDGRAFAELAHDSELGRHHHVRVTPSLVLDEGRRHLDGNVDYTVMEASVSEMLSSGQATCRSKRS